MGGSALAVWPRRIPSVGADGLFERDNLGTLNANGLMNWHLNGFPPDGSRKPLRYEGEQVPVLATRFERLFGLKHTPQIAGVNLMLELLAPNMRPIQTTRDLGSFWENTYPLVRKELRGRHPKHPWPEDPFTCPPGIHRRRKG